MRMPTRVSQLTAALVLCLATVVGAQSRATTADLSGLVTDEQKGVLPGATVTATNVATNLVRTTVTEADGHFTLPALPPGMYVLRAELAGFAPQARPNLQLALGSSVQVDFVMKLAGQAEEVTVMAQSALVDVQETAIASVVSQQQIESLPINGRSFISFSVITPAVYTDRTPQQGASATSGLSFAGQRGRSNNITVDGLDNNDGSTGAVRATFSQEAVQEFQVLTNSYTAEFGKASGGVVNIVTRSGSNRMAGNAFYYYRDKALNAKGHFEKFSPAGAEIDQEKAPYQQKQFGATLGAPLKRDTLFFFGAFERLDIDASNFVNIDSTTPLTLFGTPIGTTVDVLQRAGFPVETGNVAYEVQSSSLLTKFDLQLSSTQSAYLRFNYGGDYNENVEPWGGQIARSRGGLIDSTDYMVAMGHTWVKSSRMVNELRAQVAYRNQDVLSLDPKCSGECDLVAEGGPTLEIGAIGVGRQRFTPQPRENTRYQVLDTLSYYVGRHNFKTGFDYSFVDHTESALPLHFGGRYVFRPLPAIPGLLPAPISAIQAVAAGIPAAYIQGYGDGSLPYTAGDLSLFVQDDWRLRDNLTLKVGLRYQNQFWQESTRTVPGLAPYEWPTDNNNIAPRVAVSWDPTGDKKTSVQASYGVFYDNHITAVYGITGGISGASENVRTYVAQFPNLAVIQAWNSPGRVLREPASAYPSLVISIDPSLRTPYAHHVSAGVDRQLPGAMTLAAHFVYSRGKDQIGTLDYNPVIPSMGAGRRPLDVNGVAGTSASVLQYTSFGETWYKAMTVSLNKRFNRRYQMLAAYTLGKSEDSNTDYQSFFIPQDNGLGRDPADPNGLPIGFDPDSERGPSVQDTRHRFVFSGLVVAPWQVSLSSIVTLASGRPYNILAGVDLNGDGNGGATAPDRPRTTASDPSTSIGRNAGRLPENYTVDVRASRRFSLGPRAKLEAIFEVFNLFNRTNYNDVDNIFGTGAYPSSPLPTFGQYTQAAAPLQMQVAAKVSF